jgi:hypothetical protein
MNGNEDRGIHAASPSKKQEAQLIGLPRRFDLVGHGALH